MHRAPLLAVPSTLHVCMCQHCSHQHCDSHFSFPEQVVLWFCLLPSQSLLLHQLRWIAAFPKSGSTGGFLLLKKDHFSFHCCKEQTLYIVIFISGSFHYHSPTFSKLNAYFHAFILMHFHLTVFIITIK